MLLLFNLKLNNLNIWCCLFREISTQHGKNVAYSSGIVRELGRMLLVLQKGYARWERCCMFCRKGTQVRKGVACFTGKVRNVGKVLHFILNKYKKRRWKTHFLYLRPIKICCFTTTTI